MKMGLLWFDDNEEKSLEAKVNEAIAAYCAKPRFAGKTPNICYVHPSMLPEEGKRRLNGVRISSATTVAPHHLFVGVEGHGGNGDGLRHQE